MAMKVKNNIPKYFQIAQNITNMIKSGHLLPGAQIPSENDIIKDYGVSNTTARKALGEIERVGLVQRIKGKGTYVRRNTVDRPIDQVLAFTKNMLRIGRNPSAKVLNAQIIEADKTIDIDGHKYTLTGPCFRLERLRLGNDVPMMKDVRYISLSLCPDIDQKGLEGSLYNLYENHYGLRLEEVDQVLSATILEGEILSYFNIAQPVPAFCVDGVTFCGKGIILEIKESIWRGDIYRFNVKARSNKGP